MIVPAPTGVANACESRNDTPIRYSSFVQLADDFRPTVSRPQLKHDFAETVVPSGCCEVGGLAEPAAMS